MDITSLTAVELGKKIKAKEISVVEAVKASIAQIEKVEKITCVRKECSQPAVRRFSATSNRCLPQRQLRIWKQQEQLS